MKSKPALKQKSSDASVLTLGVQPQPVRDLSVDSVAGHTAVPACVVPVHFSQVDHAAVPLCEVCDASVVSFQLPHVLDRFSPVVHTAAHPNRRSFHWRRITHQQVWLTDGDCRDSGTCGLRTFAKHSSPSLDLINGGNFIIPPKNKYL